MILKPFQEKAISKLRKQFLELWKTQNYKIPLIFKSPTGSGKTIMMAEFLRNISSDPQFNVDKAFLWVTFSADSYEQSKKKLFNFYEGASKINLLDLNDLSNKRLENNDVFFINWQKVKAYTKEGRKLRRGTELTGNEKGIFDNFIENTKLERERVLIIDEAHTQVGTELADEIIDLIEPRIIIKITATPKEEPTYSEVEHKRAGFVEIERNEVIEAELIKEKIISQTREELEISDEGIDQDNLLLQLAFNKRLELIKYYTRLKLDINPLVLIQLPNDERVRIEVEDKTKEEITKEYLKSKGVEERQIAIWLSEKKENLEEIEKNNSDISFLIFKQAAATGWDCPRACILVMFREIQNPIFKIQTIGRILRMPEAKYYSFPELNIGYLYTNYDRNQITNEEEKNRNKIPKYYSRRKRELDTIEFISYFKSRSDYGDMGYTFQFTFTKVADEYFGTKSFIEYIDENEKKVDKTIRKNNIEKIKNEIEIENIALTNRLIVNLEIEDYDNFLQELKKNKENIDREISLNDLHKIYKLFCYEIIANQEEENKKFAPERSYGILKSALNVWFQSRITEKIYYYYKIIVYDLRKENSVLKIIIAKSLGKYKPIRNKEVIDKEEKSEKHPPLIIPRPELSFTDDYEEINKIDDIEIKKCAINPFYNLKIYKGKINEESFIKYLESNNNVKWWYKNGNYGSENFAIRYFDHQENNYKAFYPDWIVKLKNDKILIVDTKSGIFAKSNETKFKAEALQKWILKNKNNNIIGGIVVKSGDLWKINKNKVYKYDSNLTGWENLGEIINSFCS